MSAERTSRAAIAAEQLCAALWEALHDQLQAGFPDQAAVLAERIAEISRSIAALAQTEPAEIAPQAARHSDQAPVRLAEPSAPAQPAAAQPAPAQPLAPAQPAPAQPAPAEPVPGGAPVDLARQPIAESPGTSSGHGSSSGHRDGAMLIDERAAKIDVPIAIRDARAGAAETAWSTVVQRRLDRYLEDQAPFAVLLIELLDAERLRLAQAPVEAERQVRDVEAAMIGELRPADALVREADGRYWLIAPQTDAISARTVGGRISVAARRAASHRGTPLEVAIGIALCPEHGLDTVALLGHAEVDLYASEAGGKVLSDPDNDPAA